MCRTEADLYLSVITLGEIERGIMLQEPKNPDFARDLRIWLERTLRVFSDRLIEFTAEDAVRWGELSARIGHSGADLMIAAQALTRDAVVVTANGSDFSPAGVRLLDPTA
ncbi:PIN domain-containing protein [Marinibacterium profundimaris]|uniref:PIN domain-containing protein n=1 Tax=Marinibacterium profundimaris TaxID=1679460 RepID=UPI0026ACE261